MCFLKMVFNWIRLISTALIRFCQFYLCLVVMFMAGARPDSNTVKFKHTSGALVGEILIFMQVNRINVYLSLHVMKMVQYCSQKPSHTYLVGSDTNTVERYE